MQVCVGDKLQELPRFDVSTDTDKKKGRRVRKSCQKHFRKRTERRKTVQETRQNSASVKKETDILGRQEDAQRGRARQNLNRCAADEAVVQEGEGCVFGSTEEDVLEDRLQRPPDKLRGIEAMIEGQDDSVIGSMDEDAVREEWQQPSNRPLADEAVVEGDRDDDDGCHDDGTKRTRGKGGKCVLLRWCGLEVDTHRLCVGLDLSRFAGEPTSAADMMSAG